MVKAQRSKITSLTNGLCTGARPQFTPFTCNRYFRYRILDIVDQYHTWRVRSIIASASTSGHGCSLTLEINNTIAQVPYPCANLAAVFISIGCTCCTAAYNSAAVCGAKTFNFRLIPYSFSTVYLQHRNESVDTSFSLY